MYKGIAPNNIDTWSDLDGNKDSMIRSGQEVQGNAPSGDKTYVWGPFRCYVKTRDLGSWYKEVTVPPVESPPVEPPPPVEDAPDYIVAYWADGRTRKYVPE